MSSPFEAHGEGSPDNEESQALDKRLTWRLHVVQSKLNLQAARQLESITRLSLAQWRIMLAIGPTATTTGKDIRQRIFMDKGQLSRSLQSMVADGLVNASDNPRDHRQKLYSLSGSGREVYRQTLPKMRARQRFVLESLSSDEHRMLDGVLKKLERAAERREFPA